VLLVLLVRRQAGHPANVINRLVSLGQHQSVDHELIAGL
jgi:acid phosphatase family membrane protein YuiD